MPNRLADSASPYLRQHQDNPIDWYPWGEEAFFRAQLEDKPIFLSVGYSSCHWCHVMAHESFEDPAVAAFLNAHFVSIKVDREELPDVDDAYMTAVQLMHGRGGWPMSVFMTPDRKPFFAGTYFPRHDRDATPGFETLARQIALGWTGNRSEFSSVADQFAEALRQVRSRPAPQTFAPLDGNLLGSALRALYQDFDPEHGGFGEAPKFPPHTALELLLLLAGAEIEGPLQETIRERALDMAGRTLDAMWRGGFHDHVGGGFHRYSTDETWRLPHFEKMLYDNALLLANYSLAAHVFEHIEPERTATYRSIAEHLVAWLKREMTAPTGHLYSALDADSDGEEGLYYQWTPTEVTEVLGAAADRFNEDYGVTTEGNYLDEATGQRTGRNVFHLANGDWTRLESERAILRAVRDRRNPPALDDKALASWNGLAIYGLVLAGEIEYARTIAEAWIESAQMFRTLPHQVVKGEPSGRAYLDDFAAMALALFTLADAVDEPSAKRYRAIATRWLDQIEERFRDDQSGGFFATTRDHEPLFGRTQPILDSPTPSGNALAVRALLRAGRYDSAHRTLESLKGWMEAAPNACEALLVGLLEWMEIAPAPEAAHSAESTGDPVTATEPVGPPEVRLHVSNRELDLVDGQAHGIVTIEVPEGWHLNSHEPPARWMSPTRVMIEPLPNAIHYPGDQGELWTGTIEIPFVINATGEFELSVHFQACTDDSCLEPVVRRFEGIVR